jgi:hypothetical protein
MGFAAPLALLGLLAIGLPIVAHLLRRRDVPVRVLPTITLLRKADVTSRRRTRVVDRALLAARIALFALASAALAAPFVSSTLAFGDGRVTSIAIVLDDSMSMSRREDGHTLLDAARERARAIVDALPPGSEVALVLAGDPERILVPRSADLQLAREALDDLPPGTSRGTALGAAVELAARQLAGARHSFRRVLVLSDLADHAGVHEVDPRHDVSVEFERIGGAPGPANLAIAEARATPDPTTPGYTSIAVDVRNFGDARTRVPVRIEQRGRILARTEIDLAGDGGRAVLRLATPSDGTSVEAALDLRPPDGLPADDRRAVLLRGASAARILLVDGDPRPLASRGATRGGDEVRFAAHALTIAASSDRTLAHRTVDPGALSTVPLDEVDVIVLANVVLRDGPTIARIGAHLEQGGGLLIAGGDHVTPAAYGRLASVMPARVVSISEGGDHALEARDRAGAWLETRGMGLESVRSRRRLVLEPAANAEVALAWSDGMPALVLDPSHRIAVLGTSLDDAWSDLPYRPAFLPLLVQILRALSPAGAMPEASFAPGHAPVLRLPPDVTRLELVSPAGSIVSFDGPALHRPIDLDSLADPGAWGVRIATGDGALREVPRSAFVIAPPIDESDLRTTRDVSGEPDGPAVAVAASADRAPTVIRQPVGSWFYALVGLLGVLEGALRARPLRAVTRARRSRSAGRRRSVRRARDRESSDRSPR